VLSEWLDFPSSVTAPEGSNVTQGNRSQAGEVHPRAPLTRQPPSSQGRDASRSLTGSWDTAGPAETGVFDRNDLSLDGMTQEGCSQGAVLTCRGVTDGW